MPAITTSEAGDAIPDFWLNEVLRRFQATSVVARMVRRDFSRETGNKGDTIYYNKRGDLDVQEKVEGTPLTFEAPSNDKVPVILNQHHAIAWAAEDRASAKALSTGLQYMEDAVPQMAAFVDSMLLAEVENADSSVGTIGTPIGRTTMTAASRKLNDLNVPRNSRTLFISNADEEALLNQDIFVQANTGYDARLAQVEGYMGRKFGFDIVASSQVTQNTDTDNSWNGLALQRQGLVLAVRPLRTPTVGSPMGDGGSVNRWAMVVDEASGLAFRYIESYSHADLQTQFSIDILFGVKTIRPECLVQVLS